MRGRGWKFAALGALAMVLAVAGAASAEEGASSPWKRAKIEAAVYPSVLPKDEAVPVGLELRSWVRMPNAGWPPPLQSLRFHLDRDLRFDLDGIPTCLDGPRHGMYVPFPKVERECADATIGRGRVVVAFAFNDLPIFFERFPLIVVNGARTEGPPKFHILIDATVPIPALIAATATVRERRRGAFGPLVEVEIPKIGAGAGSVSSIQFRINRRIVDTGRPHPALSASCSDGAFRTDLEATYAYPDLGGEFVHAAERSRRCGRR